jgi:AcrR family transcriptional regulator
MVETGIRGFSVREVARRSGIPKSSIYRRWPTRAELLAAVLGRLSTNGEVPDTGSVRSDLVAIVRGEIESLSRSDGVLPRVALEARDDPELAPVVRDVIRGRRQSKSKVMSRAAERGEVRRDVDPDSAIDLLFGPIWSRLISHRELKAGDAEAIVDDVLRGLGGGSS